MRLNAEFLLLELGLLGPLFTHSYESYGHIVTPTWLSHLWSFLCEHNIQVHLGLQSLSTNCTNNRFLMLSFYHNGFDGKQLLLLNKCHLFLRVTTLSDISSGDGTKIIPDILSGQTNPNMRYSYTWPEQADPGVRAWAMWR